MKSTLFSLVFMLLFISCSKKRNVEPDPEPDVTNELVGTKWKRVLGAVIVDYLEFKTGKEVEYSAKDNNQIYILRRHPYTLNGKTVVYTSDGFNYTGTISGDTMTVVGTADYLIYVKMK